MLKKPSKNTRKFIFNSLGWALFPSVHLSIAGLARKKKADAWSPLAFFYSRLAKDDQKITF